MQPVVTCHIRHCNLLSVRICTRWRDESQKTKQSLEDEITTKQTFSCSLYPEINSPLFSHQTLNVTHGIYSGSFTSIPASSFRENNYSETCQSSQSVLVHRPALPSNSASVYTQCSDWDVLRELWLEERYLAGRLL